MTRTPVSLFVRFLCGLVLAAALAPALADAQLTPVRIGPGVYVVYGDIATASYDNDALTVNIGFVVTSAGVAVIDSGPSYRVAQMLDQAIQRITSNTIKYVINTGPEPARWLGNAYFRKQGIPVIAHDEARRVMAAEGEAQLQAMRRLLKEKAAGTELALPQGFAGSSQEVRFSDTTLQLSYFGPTASAGTIGVWLPRSRTVFAGAIMQAGVLPTLAASGQLDNWIAAFDNLAALQPAQIVPGRGEAGELARMSADTRAYLLALRDEAAQAKAAGAEAPARLAKSKKLEEFQRLKGYAELAPGNRVEALRQAEPR